MSQNTTHNEFVLKNVISFLLRSKNWLLATAFIAAIGAVKQNQHNPRYVTSAIIQMSKSNNSPLQAVTEKILGGQFDGGTKGYIENAMNYFAADEVFNEVAAKILKRSDADEIIKSLIIDENPLFGDTPTSAFQDAQKQIALAYHIENLTGSKVMSNESLKIWVKSNSPRTSIILVNLIAEAGISKIRQLNIKEFEEVKKFMSLRLKDVEDQIRQDQAAVINVGTRIGMVAGEALKDLPAPIIALRQEIARAQSEREHRIKLLEEMKKRFTLGQTGFESVSKFEKIQDELQYWSAAIVSKQETLKKLISGSRASPKNEQEYYDKIKKVEFNYKYYGELNNQLLQIEMMQISIANKVRLSEPGSIENTFDTRSLPGVITVALIAALAAAFATSLFLYLMEALQQPVRSRRDLQDLPITFLSEIPNLNHKNFGTVLSKFRGENNQQKSFLFWDQIKNNKLVDSIETMLFKSLRSKILGLQKKDKSFILSITSAQSSEGKTTIAGNLATVMAAGKHKTLLIDCDLRQCRLTQELNYQQKPGLSDYLHETVADYKEIIYSRNLGLSVLPAGTQLTDVVEIMLSDKFEEVLKKLKKEYDVIILDCPPVLKIAETSFIAKNSDCVLLSVVQDRTRITDISQAVEDLNFHGVENICYVMNFCGGFTSNNYLYGLNKSA